MLHRRVAVVGMFLESNAFARTVPERGFRGFLYLEGDEVTSDARAENPRVMSEVVFPVAYDEYVDRENMPFVDTPGRTSPMLRRMPFERLPRPVYPLDEGFEWTNPLAAAHQAD